MSISIFRGPSSNLCVDPAILELQRNQKNTASRLLSEESDFETLRTLAVPMNRVPLAKVIVSNDKLDTTDFKTQAKFFLNEAAEVRFLFQQVFHHRCIRECYDLVIFDCPPRLTTSSINALTASDYVLIPTKLDDNSINAVPRTLAWMEELAHICRAKLLGTVANETWLRAGQLIKDHRNAYQLLRDTVALRYPGDLVFQRTVKFDNGVVHPGEAGVVASAKASLREVFLGVAQELRSKVGI